MATIVLNIPDQVDLNQKDTIKFLAAKLYEAGKLTLGQAAHIAGLSKVAFAEILNDYDVSLMNYPSEDIIRDASRI
jgi:predicted HTH domain antitoxin